MNRAVLIAGGIITAGLATMLGALMMFLSLFATIGAGVAEQQQRALAGEGFGLSGAVPGEYRAWVMKAGSICPSVTPPMLAAQIAAESGWDPNAVNPSSQASGLTQFIPMNFGLIRDDDGNGRASPFDPGDSIMAQGRLMCEYAGYLSPAYSGEQLQRLTLAAYNIGPYKVLAGGCMTAHLPECPATMPQDPSVRAYVDKIMSEMATYAATPATLLNGGVGGPWQQPVTSWVGSGTFGQSGSMWRMCGWHTGFDYAVGTGTPVRAIHSGTVIHAGSGATAGGTGGAYGNQVIVDHGQVDGKVTRSYYDHLSAISVTTGQKVQTGQLVGVSGATGNVSGPHLHLELTIGATGMPSCGQFVDPRAFIVKHANDPITQMDAALSAMLNTTGDGTGAKAVQAAKTQLGVDYSYGGGGLNGPTSNVDGVVGFDCSSLVRFAWYQATGGKTTIPRTSEAQQDALTPITRAQLQPGDLIFFQTIRGTWSHVGMYVGGNQMIHAPKTGDVVRVAPFDDSYYSNIPTTYRRVTG